MVRYNSGMVQQVVLDYIDHIEDRVYLSTIMAAVGVERLTAAIVDLLLSSNRETVWFATIFIRDSVLYLPESPFSVAFFASPIIPVLEGLVLAENWWIRCHAVYTLGKTGCTRSLPALHHAFAVVLDRDPLLLPRLVMEIFWLEDEKSLSLIEQMMTSREYTVRWGVIGSMWGHKDASPDDAMYQAKLRYYAQLRRDPHPLIRAESDYHYRLLEAEPLGRTLPKPERRRQRKLIEQHRPSLNFDEVEQRFSNHLHQSAQSTYTIADLEYFIDAIVRDESIEHLGE